MKRNVTAVLTIQPKDKDGNQRWELADGATLYDVTHLGCRSARYTPATADNSCSPSNVRTTGFPVNPGAAMPVVNGCRKARTMRFSSSVGLPLHSLSGRTQGTTARRVTTPTPE